MFALACPSIRNQFNMKTLEQDVCQKGNGIQFQRNCTNLSYFVEGCRELGVGLVDENLIRFAPFGITLCGICFSYWLQLIYLLRKPAMFDGDFVNIKGMLPMSLIFEMMEFEWFS